MPIDLTLAAGMRVVCRDAEWLITRIDPADQAHRTRAIHCVGVDDLVRGQERVFLERLDTLTPVDPTQTELIPDRSSGYNLARLFLEAQLRQMPVTDTDPDLLGMGAFRPMEYQRQAVHRALLQLRPRLLLADAVGLGKTIEVGMILTELMRRGRANRILVLTKKSMLTQFQSELWNRFAIPLVRLDSVGISRLRLRIPANKNPFEVYHRIIISIDTLKDIGRYKHFLEATRWDVVIIDEAHNVAGASVPERHLSYRLARLLSRRTDSMLLTTATPHNGKRETFGRLISLLDPSAIPDPRLREYNAEDIKEFFLMRFKEDVRNEAGENFRDRMVVPLDQTRTAASPAEERVFAHLAAMRVQSLASSSVGKTVDTLVLYGLYKLFLSSPEACAATTAARLRKLSDGDANAGERTFLATLQAELAGQTLANSSRYAVLKDQLAQIGWTGRPGSPRVLIFTEYRHTQDALVAALAEDFGVAYDPAFDKQPEQVLASIHGSLPDIHLMSTVEAFGTGSARMRMLVATDVASEGINLHHQCHLIIHYDLPWSIITLIQRNGRIDRFGQTEVPILRYLMVNSTQSVFDGDSAIFARLVGKVEEINRSTCTGESVLKLYDPDAEERYIAEYGVLPGNADVLDAPPSRTDSTEADDVESILRLANAEASADFLAFLLGDSAAASSQSPSASTPPSTAPPTTRLRLYRDDKFLIDGYRFLAKNTPDDYAPLIIDDHLIRLAAPADLRRRLGGPDQRASDVVFGATAIPSEAWPSDNEFHLTASPDYADTAITAARNTAGHWARVSLTMEQHPILQWIGERLLMLMRRGEAPHVRSRYLKPGELCYCFIGQVSSRAGAPLVADAHAISYTPGGGTIHRPLQDALAAAHFDSLTNAGDHSPPAVAKTILSSAVLASLTHMRRLRIERDRAMAPVLRKELRRLKDWQRKRIAHLQALIDALPPTHPRARGYRNDIAEIEGYLKDREKNWQDTWFDPDAKPSTRLVLVIEGIN